MRVSCRSPNIINRYARASALIGKESRLSRTSVVSDRDASSNWCGRPAFRLREKARRRRLNLNTALHFYARRRHGMERDTLDVVRQQVARRGRGQPGRQSLDSSRISQSKQSISPSKVALQTSHACRVCLHPYSTISGTSHRHASIERFILVLRQICRDSLQSLIQPNQAWAFVVGALHDSGPCLPRPCGAIRVRAMSLNYLIVTSITCWLRVLRVLENRSSGAR